MPVHTLDFTTWGEAIEFAKRPPKVSTDRARSRQNDRRRQEGTQTTWEKALDMAVNGWIEGETQVAELSSAIITELGSLVEREVLTYDVEGMGIDIGAFLNGEPECWQRYDKVVTEGQSNRIVTLTINGTASSAVSTATITGRGAVATALISLLEIAGIRTEVTLFLGYGNGVHVYTKLKMADQPLDIARIALAVVHPCMLRTLGYSMYEQFPDTYQSDYGVPKDAPKEWQGDIYLPMMMYGDPQWTEPSLAKQWLIDNLKAQGVQITQG